MLRPFTRPARRALALACCAAILLPNAPIPAQAGPGSIVYVLTLSDANIEGLWRNTLIPDFARRFPRYTVHYTNLLHGNGALNLATSLSAAQKAGRATVDYDVVEASPLDYRNLFPPGTAIGDLFAPLNASDIPNMALVDPAVASLGAGFAVPYRASAVTLAYNSRQVPSPPATFSALLAWIRSHPGRFTYCRPDLGGSGDYFVASALRSVMDERLLRLPYNRAYERDWPRAWALLKALGPSLFQNGFYPLGNVPLLNLLARDVIWMGPVWSDQALQARHQGLLPPYIRVTQIRPPFAGGPTFLSVPRKAQNLAGAEAFINFILEPAEQSRIALAIQGFPGIRFKYLPAAVQQHFGSLAAGYGYWPAGQYDLDLQAGWRANVPAG